ncbi:uncharacterized protein TM35_000251630 [Trypanosoma theileri]|uniref:Uncharacterized protein n=1 Tax=Trypanosoma theileri TaxID=67003 RepID=A0A1X0NQA3_9TRYP|nr:uncharacterized protein TM35_000251630 [Trypanosoma theileri]ORC86867.1 hypothetical protein TM35_000251630 [Trypanosoma theileri]
MVFKLSQCIIIIITIIVSLHVMWFLLFLSLGLLLIPYGGTAAPIPPFTKAEILTKPAVNNNNNDTIPIELNIVLNSDFFTEGGTINPFAEAELRLAFNVPNPGYDMIVALDTNTYPRLRDQYGHEWIAKKQIAFSFIKEQTKVTYNTGGIPVVTRHSVSEEATVLEGKISNDPLCTAGTLACCPSTDGKHYTRYALVQSPVPPYQCTNTSVVYEQPLFSFNYHAMVTIGEENASTNCSILMQMGNESKHCEEENVRVSVNVVSQGFGFPAMTSPLCRSGNSLTDTTYSSQPIFVPFCETSQCVGYTAENYRNDRKRCGNSPLGVFTSVDGNNTNQFWYYESDFSFGNQIPRCRWMNDVVMGPGNTLEELSVRCNMFPSSNWSVTHRFPNVKPILYYITPSFLYGRANRIEARRTEDGSVTVDVEFVSLSPANGTWTLKACYESTNICSTVNYFVNGTNEWNPMHIHTLLPRTSILSKEETQNNNHKTIMVHVECIETPLQSPFRFLLRDTRVIIEPLLAIGPKKHINLDLARQPYEEIPAPPGTNGKMQQCVDDFTFSLSTGECVPFTDEECQKRYDGRRNRFDMKTRACVVTLPQRVEPIRAVPIPLRKAPEKTFDRAAQRRRLEEIQLPPWMKPMKELLREADEARQSGIPIKEVKPEVQTRKKRAPHMAVLIVNIFLILGTVFLLFLIWKRESILNWLCKCLQKSSFENGIIMEVVPARLSTYLSNSGPNAQSGEVVRMGVGSNVRYRAQQQQHQQQQEMIRMMQQQQQHQQQQLLAHQQQQQQQRNIMMHLQQQQQLQFMVQQQQQQLQPQISPVVYHDFHTGIVPTPTPIMVPHHVRAKHPNEPYSTEDS